MTLSLNRVSLIGYLGRDPEVRYTQNGMRLARLSLATTDMWRDAESGERKTETEWHRIVIFNETLSAFAEKSLMKGSHVYVEGQLKTRSWETGDGVSKKTTEIVLGKGLGELILLDPKEKKIVEKPDVTESDEE